MSQPLEILAAEIRACRICADRPEGKPLPHEPRPVLRVSSAARLAVCGQAPGTRVHASGIPFSDPSGIRLRAWMGVTDEEFYDEARVAIIPMGFCFPGLDAKRADLPPRKECAKHWRVRLMAELPQIEIVLLAGQYAAQWHLGADAGAAHGDTVKDWRRIFERPGKPRFVPLPHPSWRNNAWLKANPWFDAELLPMLRAEVRRLL